MYSRVLTCGLYGLCGEPSWVEVNVENGLPNFMVVGLANRSIMEAKERIHSAVGNCGYKFPDKRVTVNLTPANKRKEGSHFDLPIAVGTLAASGAIKIARRAEDIAFLGELTLDGRLAAIEGVLPMVIGLRKHGIRRVVIPPANLAEAFLVKDVEIYCARDLGELAGYLSGRMPPPLQAPKSRELPRPAEGLDFSDIRGQEAVKRAAQIATAGAHGMLMIGPPGVGKSMVGKRIPGIMPPLSYEEQLEVTQIYSVAGQLSEFSPLVRKRPYRAPHHSMSAVALAGGGSLPKPGEISLSHCGVLFLDELPEFSAQALQTLRQPMEDAKVTISRINGSYTYPANFMLVAAMNPCRCGYYGDPVKPCKCTESDRLRYIGRVSGPLLDRIDLHVAMERTVYEDISGARSGDEVSASSGVLREGVIRARDMQKRRYAGLGINTNAQLGPAQIDSFCRLDSECRGIMEAAFSRYAMSARSYHRTLKVARTVADLAQSEEIRKEHLLEALSYRMPEKFLGVLKWVARMKGSGDMNDIVYYVWLSLVRGMSADAKLYLMEIFGDARAVFEASETDLLQVMDSCDLFRRRSGCARLLEKNPRGAERCLTRAEDLGAELIAINSPDYPRRLKEIPDPPIVLFAMGKVNLLSYPCISVVGTRRASPYGKWAAAEIAKRCAACGLTVVSGMAEGIDSFAHRGCFAVGGNTIAVFGTGVDVCFPRSNLKLYEEILEKGLVISEYEFGEQGRAYHFPERNRIISGLSGNCVIVEGTPRSGSLITAGLAASQDRGVFAVPGNINQPGSEGPNLLISEGATPVVSIDRLIDTIAGEVPAHELVEKLLPEERKLYEHIVSCGSSSRSYLISGCDMDAGTASMLITSLELKGFIKTDGARVYPVI